MSFRDLERIDRLVADAARYKAWKAKDSEQRQDLYETLDVNKFTYLKDVIWVAPFGIAAKNTFVAVQAPQAGQSPPTPTLRTLLAGYFLTAAPTGTSDSILTTEYFPTNKLAKLTLKLRVTDSTARRASRITGRKYHRHSNNSASMAFGKKVTTDSYGSAVADIKNDAALTTFINAKKGNAVIFTPEG